MDIRSTVRVADKTIFALGRIAIMGAESLSNKDTSQSTGPPTRYRISKRRLRIIRNSLSERDVAVITVVKDCRLITPQQIQRLYFTQYASPYLAARACRRTLKKLFELHILSRRIRRIGGARRGSASFVYSLGLVGARIVSPDKRLWFYNTDPNENSFNHALEEAELYTKIHEASTAGKFELLEIQTEPSCWRVVPFTSGKLRPDTFLRLASKDEEFSYFIEVDRDTTHRPSLLKKLWLYDAYFQTGMEQQKYGVFPLVVWIVPDEKSKAALEKLITTTPRLKNDLFSVTLMYEIPHLTVT